MGDKNGVIPLKIHKINVELFQI